VILLFITGLYGLGKNISLLVFKGMKAHLFEQKNHLHLKIQTQV